MQYLGKVIGVVVVLLMGGGFWGVVFGFLVGYMFDWVCSCWLNFFVNQQECQLFFFFIIFEVMGYLIKFKGCVIEVDIYVVNVLMDCMNLYGVLCIVVQQVFCDGKVDNYFLCEKMCQLCSVCFGCFDLIWMFLEIQLQVVFVDGELYFNEWEVLFVIVDEFGIFCVQFD